MELLWVCVRYNNRKFNLGVCYRPPSSSSEFWDLLQDSIHMVKALASHPIILCGDFNAEFNMPNGNKLFNFASINNLTIHVNEPTRITENSSTVLDQFLTNIQVDVKEVAIHPPVSSNDHSSVVLKLNFKHVRNYSYTRNVWFYAEADFDGFRHALSSVEWDECFQHDDINLVYDTWCNKLLEIDKQFIPNRSVTICLGDKPWYSNELRLLKRKKDRAHFKVKQLNTPAHWAVFKALCNKYCINIKSAKSEYFKNISDNIEQTGGAIHKQFWHFAKSILGKAADCCFPPLKHGEIICTDNLEKAELFNRFFVGKCQLNEINAYLLNELELKTHSTLSYISVTLNEVTDSLLNLEVTKAYGPDFISPCLLKEGAHQLAPSLTSLFNYSLNTCQIPVIWKTANVIPILKKGDQQEVSNYRPVSLLSAVSKCFEKIIFKHVYNYFRDNSILSKSAYRNVSSICTGFG